jgi:indolepyruvate decarboxylase
MVKRARYDNVPMRDLLEFLVKEVEPSQVVLPKVNPKFEVPPQSDDSAKITADDLYPRLQAFIQSGDTVMVETGSLGIGSQDFRLPSNVEFHNQGLWMSIGYATPATLGAGLAAPKRRLLLFTGEGSFQLTAQEISSMLRYRLKPIIILLNNDGYMIERYLCTEPMDPFNDLAPWRYSRLAEAFGATDAFTTQVKTVGELDKALKDAAASGKFSFIEVSMDKMEAPKVMRDIRAHRDTLYGSKNEEADKLGRPTTPENVAACPG